MANQSTKDLVSIADIKDSIVLLKNGSLRAVIDVSAINFELRSEEEQMGILQNFQRFLNSTDFPLQIVTSSRQLNMDGYLKMVDGVAEAAQNELLKIQAIEYGKFVKELLELSNIMTKHFYVVLPFYVFETPTKTGILDGIKEMFGSSQTVQQIKPEQLETYRTQLMQRAELILDGLIGIGLKAHLLEGQDLINLYYSLYNPGEKMDTSPPDKLPS
jgi:type IV secretory pathway VirB4 component